MRNASFETPPQAAPQAKASPHGEDAEGRLEPWKWGFHLKQTNSNGPFLLIATLAFGLITPPYGLALLMASKFVGVRFSRGLIASFPIYIIYFVTIAFAIFFPSVILWLPKHVLPECGLLQGSPNRQLYLPLTAALSGEFGHKAVRVVNLRKSFAKSTHVDGNRAVPRGIVSKISAQRLLVPVENQPHDLAGAVDDRRA